MRKLLTTTALLAVTALGTAGVTAPVASAAPGEAPANPQFCEAALSVYDTSLQYDGRGAFPEAAKIGAGVRASAKYAPPKVAKDAQNVAKLYDAVAKMKNAQAQAMRWGRLSVQYRKSVKSYFGYFVSACSSYLAEQISREVESGSSGSGASSTDPSSGSSYDTEDE